MKFLITALMLAISMSPAGASDFKMPDSLDKLSDRAKETVDVTLDQSMLQLASGFLSPKDPDEAKAKKLVSKLKGVYVRSYEFDKEGEYSPADVASIRAQVKGPEWSRIVGVKSKSENTEIYIKKNGEQIEGIIVLAAEPKELTVIHIDGPINPEELSELGGHMGIPKIGLYHEKSKEEE